MFTFNTHRWTLSVHPLRVWRLRRRKTILGTIQVDEFWVGPVYFARGGSTL